MLPTPAMAPAIACVVDTGTPRCVEISPDAAAPVSAQKPLRGLSRVRRPPMVRTMRHPPLSVPSAIAEYDAISTHVGTSKARRYLEVYSTPVMMPAVFCASFEPCERDRKSV